MPGGEGMKNNSKDEDPASIQCSLGSVLDVLRILTLLIFPTTLRGMDYNNLHFTDEET